MRGLLRPGSLERGCALAHFRRDAWVGKEPPKRRVLFAAATAGGEVSDAGGPLRRIVAAVDQRSQVDLVETLRSAGRGPRRSGLDPAHYLAKGGDPGAAVRALRQVSRGRHTGRWGVSEHQDEDFPVRQAT